MLEFKDMFWPTSDCLEGDANELFAYRGARRLLSASLNLPGGRNLPLASRQAAGQLFVARVYFALDAVEHFNGGDADAI